MAAFVVAEKANRQSTNTKTLVHRQRSVVAKQREIENGKITAYGFILCVPTLSSSSSVSSCAFEARRLQKFITFGRA